MRPVAYVCNRASEYEKRIEECVTKHPNHSFQKIALKNDVNSYRATVVPLNKSNFIDDLDITIKRTYYITEKNFSKWFGN